jgi:hypothetical protein
MALSSLSTLRAAMTMFAPLADNWRAAARPMPSDPPVMRMVLYAQY